MTYNDTMNTEYMYKNIYDALAHTLQPLKRWEIKDVKKNVKGDGPTDRNNELWSRVGATRKKKRFVTSL